MTTKRAIMMSQSNDDEEKETCRIGREDKTILQ
jgi:hypothetical protein